MAAGPDSAAFDLTLFVIHYKSGGPGNYWREKEAAKTAELVAAFEQAVAEGKGAVAFHGRMIDGPIADIERLVLERARKAGKSDE